MRSFAEYKLSVAKKAFPPLRSKEMDSTLCRLALFLDPQYKDAADVAGHFN
jgi:hypothetical protein